MKHAIAFFLFLALSGLQHDEAAGGEPQQGFIPVRNPRILPAKIPCERITLGKRGDYKPCIARLPNGELLVVAFYLAKRINANFVLEKNLLWRSTDGGRTWTPRTEFPLLGTEAYFSVLADGTLFITATNEASDVANKLGYAYTLLHRSTDGGKTWQSTKIGREHVPGAPEKTTIRTSRNVLELKDGTLVLIVAAPKGLVYLWRSEDRGKTWDKTMACNFAGVDKAKFWYAFMAESVLWQTPSGDLLALPRVNEKHFPIPGTKVPEVKIDQYSRLLLFRSKDGGRNWRMEELGSYYGEMYPALLRLSDGRMLMTFTMRAAYPPNVRPLGVRCVVGGETDDGFQFDFKQDRIMLDTKTPDDSISGGGFGPTVQLDDGTLVTAYSYAGPGGFHGGDFHVEVVRWRLPKPKTGR